MRTIALVGLVKMALPGGDIRLCDGGWFDFDGERYRDSDPIYGSVGSVGGLTEGIGDEVPALQLTLLPPGTSEPGDLHQAGMQRSPSWWWTAEYDVETGLIDEGTAELEFYGQIDQCSLELDESERRLAMSHVSAAEVLFERDIGNSMNSAFHELCFPGELGHDEATGLGRQEAWGTVNPGSTPGGGSTLPSAPWRSPQVELPA